MLQYINNPDENPEIHALNIKIHEYNEADAAGDVRLYLLQEINYMHHYINDLYMDHQSSSLADIKNFSGINKELPGSKLPMGSGNLADTFLISLLSRQGGLPTVEQWKRQKRSEQELSVLGELTALDRAKARLEDPQTPQQAQNYFHALGSFREVLLHKLSFELTEEKEIQQFRILLSQINKEIHTIKNHVETVSKQDATARKVAFTDLYQELGILSSQQKDQLALMLRNPANENRPEDIRNILTTLNDYEIKSLGGANNLNWKLKHHESGMELVLQVGQPAPNQRFMNALSKTKLSQYFAQKFFSSTQDPDAPFAIVLTEFCPNGDIQSMRKKTLADATHETIIKEAINNLGKLITICNELHKEKAAHPDIKLPNFLVTDEHKIIIADKKALIPVNEDGTIDRESISTSPPFTPPEFTNINQEKFNAEAFMSYQLGLALYCYLVPDAPHTFDKKPPDFSYPVFASEQGIKMKNLITDMIKKDPEERPKLATVKATLAAIKGEALAKEEMHCSTHAHEITASYKYRVHELSTARKHGINVEGQHFTALREEYKTLKGDVLKSKILDALKIRIENTTNPIALQELKKEIKGSAEYQVLNSAQGTATGILQKFGKNTTSIDTLNEMFAEQKRYLKNSHRPE